MLQIPDSPNKWETLGDDPLAQVVAAAIYGRTQPSVLSFPQVDGYKDDDVASGIALVGKFTALIKVWDVDPLTQVKVAVEEWSDGELKLIHNLIEITEHMDSKIKAAKAVIANFKDGHPKAWRSFCLRVH